MTLEPVASRLCSCKHSIDKIGLISGKKSMNNNSIEQRNDTNPESWGRGGFYEIRIKGSLNHSWSDWLDGMDIRPAGDGETILSGWIRDQAALFGILGRLFSLNIPLISVNKHIL